MPNKPQPLTDAELDERITASIARVLANVERNRTKKERTRQRTDPTTTKDRTDAIIPEND